jgi:D-alanine-D-alanine ligase
VTIAHGSDDRPRPRGRRRGRKNDVEEIAEILRRGHHDVSFVELDGRRGSLGRLRAVRADLVFNLVEGFGSDDTKEPHVTAYYELLGLRYTGSGPRGLTVGMDKALTKKVLSFHGVRTPQFATVFRSRVGWADDVTFPVMVKPVREDGSIGIGFASLVDNLKDLIERIDRLHAEFNQPVLVEQYVEGREIYVGVIGNARPEVFPPIELDLSHLPKGTPRIASQEVKWQEGTRAYRGSRYRTPALPASVLDALGEAALIGFAALGLRDYARFDFRLAADGTPYLIEANPNPYLHSTSEFIKGARGSGRTHPETILAIIDLALARYGARG